MTDQRGRGETTAARRGRVASDGEGTVSRVPPSA